MACDFGRITHHGVPQAEVHIGAAVNTPRDTPTGLFGRMYATSHAVRSCPYCGGAKTAATMAQCCAAAAAPYIHHTPLMINWPSFLSRFRGGCSMAQLGKGVGTRAASTLDATIFGNCQY